MTDKPGTVLYEYCVDEPSGKITRDEWIVRTVRGGFTYAVLKTSYTWGKRSTKHGDFGWLDPIPAFCRRKKRTSSEWPEWCGMATTKKKAIKLAIKIMLAYSHDDDYEGITVAEIVKKLQSLYKRS